MTHLGGLDEVHKLIYTYGKAMFVVMISFVMKDGVMDISRMKVRWNAVCGESRMHGVGEGKIRKHKKRQNYLFTLKLYKVILQIS